MTTVPYHLQHDGRDYALQYVHSSEADAKADSNERDTAALVQPLELDRRYYAVYTVSVIEKHSTEVQIYPTTTPMIRISSTAC
jgi:hypothetical protein